MNMSFAKLDSKITSSSLWDQPDHVVRVWIAFLAEKDENGFVCGTPGSMRRLCNVTDDPDGKKFEHALQVLESPDENSKTPDYNGRRIDKIDGGWLVLNHEKYRLHDNIVREQTRERVRKYRENHSVNKKVTHSNVTGALPSVSVSESVSESKEGMQGEEKSSPNETMFELFRKEYPGTKRGLKTEYENYCKKHNDHKFVLPMLSPALSNQKQWRTEMATAGMFVPEWPGLAVWINQRRWELEKPVIQNKTDQQPKERCRLP